MSQHTTRLASLCHQTNFKLKKETATTKIKDVYAQEGLTL